MKADFVYMKLCEGMSPFPISVGETIWVFREGEDGEEMKVPMRVLKVYSDGSFYGEVIWGEV